MSYVGRNIFGLTDIGTGYFENTYTIGTATFQGNEDLQKIIITDGVGNNIFRVCNIGQGTGANLPGFYSINGTIRNTFTISSFNTPGFLVNNNSGVITSTTVFPFPITLINGAHIVTDDNIPLSVTDNSSSYNWYIDRTNRWVYQNISLHITDPTGLDLFEVDSTTKKVSFFYGLDELQLSYNSTSTFPMFQTITNTADYVQFPRLLVGGQVSSMIDSDLQFQFRKLDGTTAHWMSSTSAYFTSPSIATQIVPTSDNAVKLGSSTLRWSEVNAFNSTFRGDMIIIGTNSIGKVQVYNNSGSLIFGISTSTGTTSFTNTITTGDFKIQSFNTTTKFQILDFANNVLLLMDTTTPKFVIGNASRAVTINLPNGTANSFLKLDASKNITYDSNTYLTTSDAASTYMTKISPVWSSGTFSTPLTASQLVATNGTSQITTIAYSSSNTASAIVQRDVSGNFSANTLVLTGLSASQLVATNASNALITIPYDVAATANTIVQRDAGGNIAVTSISISGLSPSQLVATNASNVLISMPYATAATASTIMQRDASGNTNIVQLNATTVSSQNYYAPNLTINNLVATNAFNAFISIVYATAATANAMVQRDSSAGITCAAVSCTSITTNGGNATMLGTTSLASTNISAGNSLSFKRTSGNDIAISNSAITGTAATLRVYNTTLASGNDLFIIPGYKQSTLTSGYVTYDIPGTGTHYFWDNVENSGTISSGSNIYCGTAGTTTTPGISFTSFTGCGLSAASSTLYILANSTVGITINGTQIIPNRDLIPSGNGTLDIGSTSLRYSSGYINALYAQSLNLSGLTASQVVATDGSKNLTTLNYTTTNTNFALVQRDSSGNFVTAGITLNNLTPITNGTGNIGNSSFKFSSCYINTGNFTSIETSTSDLNTSNANHFASSGCQFANVPQGSSSTAALTLTFKSGFVDGDCCIIKILGVANGAFNNGAVQYFESTCGFFYQASIWKTIGSAPAITYTGGGLFSYYWYVSGTTLQVIANQNSGQSGVVSIAYEIVYSTKN